MGFATGVPSDKMARVARELVELLVKNAAAELTTYYYDTILRANLIELEGESCRQT